jgi:hypothetical protein
VKFFDLADWSKRDTVGNFYGSRLCNWYDQIIDMQTLGIGNGYIDSVIQFPYGPLMWVSNSYGMSNLVFHADDRTATDDLAFANAMRGFLTPGELLPTIV